MIGQWFLVLAAADHDDDECSPYMVPHGVYDTSLEAQAAAGPAPAAWEEHPRGGFMHRSPRFTAWTAPVETLSLIEDL